MPTETSRSKIIDSQDWCGGVGEGHLEMKINSQTWKLPALCSCRTKSSEIIKSIAQPFEKWEKKAFEPVEIRFSRWGERRLWHHLQTSSNRWWRLIKKNSLSVLFLCNFSTYNGRSFWSNLDVYRAIRMTRGQWLKRWQWYFESTRSTLLRINAELGQCLTDVSWPHRGSRS